MLRDLRRRAMRSRRPQMILIGTSMSVPSSNRSRRASAKWRGKLSVPDSRARVFDCHVRGNLARPGGDRAKRHRADEGGAKCGRRAGTEKATQAPVGVESEVGHERRLLAPTRFLPALLQLRPRPPWSAHRRPDPGGHRLRCPARWRSDEPPGVSAHLGVRAL
jgi:hypothetical protein